MTFNLKWVIKEKTDFFPAKDTVKACPYSRKTLNSSARSLAGRCLAWTGFCSSFAVASDIHQFCQKDFSACPLYKATAGGVSGECLSGDTEDLPGFSL